jgi:predicted RNA-binding protein with PUA-like domain
MKSEPDVFSFSDLKNSPKMTACWEGVRNYQARNFMRDQFQVGDGVLFYHSSTEEPSIVGQARVSRKAYDDNTALDEKSPYFDAKSKALGCSRWVMVDVTAVCDLVTLVNRKMMADDKVLRGMKVMQKGMRLSITPVSPAQWQRVLALGVAKAIKG